MATATVTQAGPATSAAEPPDDALFALQLQLEDINILYENIDPKGKRREDDVNDTKNALDDFKVQVETAMQLLADERLARSYMQAIDADAGILRQHLTDEVRAATDHQLASRLHGHYQPNVNEDTAGDDLAAATAASQALFLHEPSPGASSAAESSSRPSTSSGGTTKASALAPPLSRTTRFLDESEETGCVCCREEKLSSSTRLLACGHLYCLDCLKDLFMRSTKDESLYPPRCCRQEIGFEDVFEHLTEEERERFLMASVEFSTTNRTYCSNKRCGIFILPENIKGDDAQCQDCRAATCVICKQGGHIGDCPADANIQTTLELAADKSWRRCNKCLRIVELSVGCNHITCICGAQWCYLCGVAWKKCLCEQFTLRHLIATAENVADREAPDEETAAARQTRLEQLQQQLLANHDCTHPGRLEKVAFDHRQGQACDVCQRRVYKWILRCRTCHVDMCWECCRNRV